MLRAALPSPLVCDGCAATSAAKIAASRPLRLMRYDTPKLLKPRRRQRPPAPLPVFFGWLDPAGDRIHHVLHSLLGRLVYHDMPRRVGPSGRHSRVTGAGQVPIAAGQERGMARLPLAAHNSVTTPGAP